MKVVKHIITHISPPGKLVNFTYSQWQVFSVYICVVDAADVHPISPWSVVKHTDLCFAAWGLSLELRELLGRSEVLGI